MKRIFKLFNLKLNQLWMLLLVGTVIQIVVAAVFTISFALSSTVTTSDTSTATYLSAVIEIHQLKAMVATTVIGAILVVLSMLKNDYKNYSLLGVSNNQNAIANTMIGGAIAIVMSIGCTISSLISLCVLRLLDGFWLSSIINASVAIGILKSAALCILIIFTLYMFVLLMKAIYHKSPYICVAIAAVVLTLVFVNLSGVIAMQDFKEKLFSCGGGSIALGILSMVFTATYGGMMALAEVKR